MFDASSVNGGRPIWTRERTRAITNHLNTLSTGGIPGSMRFATYKDVLNMNPTNPITNEALLKQRPRPVATADRSSISTRMFQCQDVWDTRPELNNLITIKDRFSAALDTVTTEPVKIYFFGGGSMQNMDDNNSISYFRHIAFQLIVSFLIRGAYRDRTNTIELHYNDPTYTSDDEDFITQEFSRDNSYLQDGDTIVYAYYQVFVTNTGKALLDCMNEDSIIVTFSCEQPYRQILADLWQEKMERELVNNFPLIVIATDPRDEDSEGRNNTSSRVLQWGDCYSDKLPLFSGYHGVGSTILGSTCLMTRVHEPAPPTQPGSISSSR